MAIDWLLSISSLIGAGVLLGAAVLARKIEKTVVAPATAMLLTWGLALLFLSLLPVIGFYYVSAEAVVLYVLGTLWFAVVALITGEILKRYSKKPDSYPIFDVTIAMNYSRLYLFSIIIAVIAFPLAILDILSYGSNITEISYSIRRASVGGEAILNPIIDNLFVVIGILLSIMLFGAVKGKLKLYNFMIVSIPYVLLVLIVFGRSGLISLILGWLTIIIVFSERLKIRYVIGPIVFLIAVVYLGGVWVKKFDTEGQSIADTVITLLEHIFGYLYQGPILFSRFLTNDIYIATNWDFLESTCYVLSKLDMCTPINSPHADFAYYSSYEIGNVYSIYFSIIPHYGILGLTVAFTAYGCFLASLFYYFKKMSLFALVVYPNMFAAIILSVFKDGIGYSVYWQIKVLVICLLVSLFLTKKTTKSKSNKNSHYNTR